MITSGDFSSDRAEDIAQDSLERLFVEVNDADKTFMSALMSPGAHLLEGSRGSGKTMMLRVAYERLRSRLDRKESTTLPVFVRFPNYLSTYNPKTVSSQPFNPFTHWVVAKLIDATEKAATEYALAIRDEKSEKITNIAPKYIERLEEHYRDESVSDLTANATRLHVETRDLELFGRLDDLAANLLGIARQRNTSHIAFFLDEAAQNFAEELQPIFFQILKHLRHEKISVKAAVYPFVTSYGKDFDIGQDAQMLRLDRFYEDEATDAFYDEFFSKRIAPDSSSQLNEPETRKFIRIASGGNPRWILHFLGRLAGKEGRLTSNDLIFTAKYFSDETLWPFLENLGHRLKSRRKYVEVAVALVQTFTEDLRNLNKDIGKSSEQRPTVYLAISNSKIIPFRVHQAIQLLLYSGILSTRGPKRISSRENGQLYILHPALIIRENSLFGRETNPSVNIINNAYTNPQREKFKEYTKNSPRISDTATNIDSSLDCVCDHCGREMPKDSKFCPYCGNPITEQSLYQELLELSSETLELSHGIKSRLLEFGEFPTVGSITMADDNALKRIPYIGETRARLIKYAAEEVLSG